MQQTVFSLQEDHKQKKNPKTQQPQNPPKKQTAPQKDQPKSTQQNLGRHSWGFPRLPTRTARPQGALARGAGGIRRSQPPPAPRQEGAPRPLPGGRCQRWGRAAFSGPGAPRCLPRRGAPTPPHAKYAGFHPPARLPHTAPRPPLVISASTTPGRGPANRPGRLIPSSPSHRSPQAYTTTTSARAPPPRHHYREGDVLNAAHRVAVVPGVDGAGEHLVEMHGGLPLSPTSLLLLLLPRLSWGRQRRGRRRR